MSRYRREGPISRRKFKRVRGAHPTTAPLHRAVARWRWPGVAYHDLMGDGVRLRTIKLDETAIGFLTFTRFDEDGLDQLGREPKPARV